MDWIVFGDDWGVHPSTMQHLILNLPPEDRVVWVDSIGMRQPALNISDVRRFCNKAAMMVRREGKATEGSLYKGTLEILSRVKPKVIPWHLNHTAIRLNKYFLAASIRHAMQILGLEKTILLSSTPVVAQYLQSIPHQNVFYLRQDDYEHFPGCDPVLVQKTEPMMFDAAEVIFVTARSLSPKGHLAEKTRYLPQGVQSRNFSTIPAEPSGQKILGFFGTIDERMDFELVKAVAKAAPDWQLEFIGETPYKPPWIDSVTNIHFKSVVPFAELPKCLSDWTVAWIPYLLNDVTYGINPLKLREYLAAGLASHCTPLPEALALTPQVMVTDQAKDIVRWMNETLASDSSEVRLERRESVRCHDWSDRSSEFRRIIRDTLGAEGR